MEPDLRSDSEVAVLNPTVFTWANALTSARLVAAPFFFCALVGGADRLALVLFWGAVATDVADGRIARARGETSAFGGLLDHATDASFVTLGLCALARDGIVPTWLPFLVVAAFIQYVLDSRSLAGRTLRASALGRWNGIFYFVPLGTIATREGLGLAWPPEAWVTVIGWALVGTTLISMGERAWVLLRSRVRGA